MKIGTLTFPNSPSHGAALQMYALWKLLEELDCEAEVINYTSNVVIHNRQVPSKKSPVAKLKSKVYKFLFGDVSQNFQTFEAKTKKYPAATIGMDEIKNIADRYDRIIVGSDQVWNPIVTGNDFSFYLDFLDDSGKKATYAPSFGNDSVAKEDESKIAELLSDITYLSAREKQGAKIIKELTGRDVPVVLDPTFLLKKEKWQELEVKPKYKKEYVLFYTIKPSPALYNFAQRLADEQNLILVTIGGKPKDKFNPKKHSAFGVGPSEFLGLVSNAKYVVTNSFHGTAFSIIYRKNFYVEYSTDTNSRLINLIEGLELTDCVVDPKQSPKAIKVNYSNAEILLNEQIEKSVDYLKSIVKE